VISDVVMPGMNGRELRDTLAEDHPGIRVMFMSGYTNDVIERHGIVDGSERFLQKPFSLNDLGAAVREALREG
jgi:two-component system, cell cycle sensor histidine kinase and response regulator CckA